MSSQLIVTIILIFLTFFVLQILLNSQFFQNYYTEREFNAIHTELIEYVDQMNQPDADYYDEMFQFTSLNNTYSVVTGKDYRIANSLYNDYTIVVNDVLSGFTYEFLVPENIHTYTQGEIILINGYEFGDDVYTPVFIDSSSTGYTFDNDLICADDCVTVSGSIASVHKPINLNFQFEQNRILQQELKRLPDIDLLEISYTDGYWYQSSYEQTNVLVFIHELGTFDFIITIIPIENTADIIGIVSSYNNYVYLTAIVIIFLWSFRLTNIMSKPVQNIEGVARQIANLNFDVEAHEYNNRENTSLSNSINLISKNLKETLDALSYRNDELRTLYDNQMKQVTLKKQLVSSISHELKTPLMIIQVTIQGILDGIIEMDDQEKELENILEEVNKSSIMIQDMLQIYRLDDAEVSLDISEINLSKMVNFFIADFENVLRKHELRIDLNLDSSIRVEADEKLIKRVVSNFFTNALKYTPDEERIYIEVSETDDHVYFELTNFGTNIKDEDLENIWLPFFRSQTETNQTLRAKGSGIGLYLVSEILKAHNAEFGINNVDNGVQAYFKLLKKH